MTKLISTTKPCIIWLGIYQSGKQIGWEKTYFDEDLERRTPWYRRPDEKLPSEKKILARINQGRKTKVWKDQGEKT